MIGDYSSIQKVETTVGGAKYKVEVLSNYWNLEYIMTTKLLNQQQAWWSEFLSHFNFEIACYLEKWRVKPDALTRRWRDVPEEWDKRLTQ